MARLRTTRSLVAAFVVAASALSAQPGLAADSAVAVRPDFTYSPAETTIEPGDTVTWAFTDAVNSHTVDDGTGLDLFESGVRKAGSPPFAYKFTAAGSYGYFCLFHRPSMVGRVSVGMTSEAVDRGYILRWASRRAPDGFVYDVKMKAPGEDQFTWWRHGTSGFRAAFTPPRRGVTKFKARLRRVSDGESSGFSPLLSVQR